MTTLTRALAMLALAALLVGLAGVGVILGSDHASHRGLAAAVTFFIGAAWVGTGIYVWWRRPANRFGALMTWTGFAWLLTAFTAADAPGVFTLAVITSNVYIAAFIHLLFSYPEGRLRCRAERRLTIAGYTLAVLGPIPVLLFGFDRSPVGCDCPDSVIQISNATAPGTVMDVVASTLAVALVGWLVVLLWRRWRAASGPQRTTMAPLIWSGMALLILVVVGIAAESVSGATGVSTSLLLASQLVFGSVPFVFLVGLLRTRVARADAVAELLLRLGEAPGTDGLRGLLAEALDDPTLKLLYWIDGRWVKRDGSPTELPRDRAWTAVELEGRRVGAIVHDRSLRDEPELLRSIAAAAGLSLEHERLEAALGARLEELRRSRTRIVEAGLAERRRLERNLHDGAQQRLVALSLTLRIAQNKIAKQPEVAAKMVGEAQEELTRALEELRELARGIHPAVLSDRGLQAAVEALATRSPLPVTVTEVPGERLPEPVEAAAYFVIAEALTNVAKYANASAATVAVRRINGHAEVEVADDGVGGADPGRGSGLRGLADRVGALDGIPGTRLSTRVGHYSASGDSRMSPSDTPVKVVVAEDSVLLREGLVRLLEDSGFEVAGQAGDAEDLLRKVGAHKPDVAVIDVRMPPSHTDEGLRAARKIRADHPKTGVLVLSQYVEEAYALDLLSESTESTGYLLKDRVADVDTFTDAVRRVAGGGSALDPEVVALLLGRRRREDPLEGLTAREREVLGLMAEGRSNAAIAEALVVTERAVEKHVTSIFSKLDLTPTVEDHRRVLAVLAYLRAS